MTRSLRRRGIAAGALALASGTMLASVATAGPAMASPLAPAGFMSGSTQSDVVQVLVNLPTTIPGLNTNRIALGLISSSGSAFHDGINHSAPDASQAFAQLASGTLVDGASAPLAALGKSVTADLANRSASGNLGALPSNPVASGTVGALSAVVHDVLDNTSTANLTNLNLLTLSDLLPSQVLQPITSGAQQATTAAQGVVSQVLQQLQPVLQPIEQNDPTGTAAQLQAALQQLNSQLGGLVQNIENTPLVSIDLLDSNQTIGQQNNGLNTQAHAKLANLNVLGGLVHLDGFTSDATAFADGVAGDATGTGTGEIANVSVGKSILNATLNANGLGLSVAGLPVSVVSQVNSALAQVSSALNSVLANIGLKITPSAGSAHAISNGYEATGEALDISLTPPTAAQPLLDVKLGGTTAIAQAEQAPVIAPIKASKTLAFTGANLPLTAGGGLVLLVGAAVLRRRWRAGQV